MDCRGQSGGGEERRLSSPGNTWCWEEEGPGCTLEGMNGSGRQSIKHFFGSRPVGKARDLLKERLGGTVLALSAFSV